MELQLIDEMGIELGRDCELSLPEYMVRLAPEDVFKQENPSSIVVAAGADPCDGKILLVTVSGGIFIFDARKFCIPDGPAEPTEGGKKVFLRNVKGRWPGQSIGFFVDVKWLLKNSTSALAGATLHTNYVNENRNK